MDNLNIESIKREVIVGASQMTAFKVFTEKMDLWWPSTHHIGQTPVTGTVLEPRVKGRWYTLHEDGNEVNVGHVLEWDPYALVVLAWQINGDYQYDPELITEVEVHFIPEGPKTTKIKFEHKNLDRLGGSKAIESMDYGWGWILQLYKTHIES
jgi:uncharacterized protein YndB with AHSA1/START domain